MEVIPKIILLIYYINFSKCTDFDSYEFNRIEFTPIHDAIIFNDIADIMNEIESNMDPRFDHINNSESEEEIEHLLSEYQQYLDKAHEQTVKYIRKNKSKNKVPLFRHEKFSKLKSRPFNFDENNYYFDYYKHPVDTAINNYMPQNSNIKAATTAENVLFLRSKAYDKNMIDLPPKIYSELLPSSCYCKENIMPCKCGCNQRLIIDSVFPRNSNKIWTNQDVYTDYYPIKFKPMNESDSNNNLNIQIKIDVQLPNISMLNNAIKYQNQRKNYEREDALTKETQAINFPFPYLSFPISMTFFGNKQNMFKESSSPVHKIHKKKKYRLNNNIKKHKTKNLITLHHFNFETIPLQNITEEYFKSNQSKSNNSIHILQDTELTKNMSDNFEVSTTLTTQINKTSNQSMETIYINVNISKQNHNYTEDILKSENSIETDISADKYNTSTLIQGNNLRFKREIATLVPKTLTKPDTITINRTKTSATNRNNEKTQVNVNKNSKQDSTLDIELLYWPTGYKNQSLIQSKNITALILDREIRKAKLNMTDNSIRNNRTMALEKAIFGKVNWDDIDMVVPVFMSFVGKYIRGVLTFCSENVCHSMKCAEKLCNHRICTLENRYNQIGHCISNNHTDSVATMESIMDLPSNIAFEVVDILQEKMLGKLFGKVTVCINSKCSAFAVFKKRFQKAKCSFKDLTLAGHCPNLKNVKII